MNNFNQPPDARLPADENQLDSETKQLQKDLERQLEELKERLKTETRRQYAEAFQELKRHLDESDKEALRQFHQTVESSKRFLGPVRESSVEFAKQSYRDTLKMNKKLLEKFVRDCGF